MAWMILPMRERIGLAVAFTIKPDGRQRLAVVDTNTPEGIARILSTIGSIRRGPLPQSLFVIEKLGEAATTHTERRRYDYAGEKER